MQITINVDEATGQITVEAEGQEPYQCSSTDECLEYLGDMLKGEQPGEPAGEEAADPQSMWDQEANKRSQPGLMA